MKATTAILTSLLLATVVFRVTSFGSVLGFQDDSAMQSLQHGMRVGEMD